MLLRGANKAEANAVAVARVFVVAALHGTVVHKVAPTAPTPDAVLARRRTSRWRVGRNSSIPVPAKFPYVSGHVVEAFCVSLLFLYFMFFFSAIFVIPGNVSYCVASAISCLPRVRGVATAG